MNTEMTDTGGTSGSVFYDAACPLCRAVVALAGPLFSRRGFAWCPLQAPDARQRLNVPEADLLSEMKLQLRDGRIIGGIDSWIYLFRSVRWLWPIGFLISLPGIHSVARVCYGWIARHRRCASCHAVKPAYRRKIPFLDLP